VATEDKIRPLLLRDALEVEPIIGWRIRAAFAADRPAKCILASSEMDYFSMDLQTPLERGYQRSKNCCTKLCAEFGRSFGISAHPF
jgi:hypothetical protein